MILLPNNCRCSQPKVSINKKTGVWRIYYRFYQPEKKPLFVEVKAGINDVALSKRPSICKVMIQELLGKLRQGLNPVTGQFVGDFSISPSTPMMEALQECLQLIDVTDHTREDIRSTLRYVAPAAAQLRYNYLPISDVRRKHIKALLNRVAVIKPTMNITVKNKKGEEKILGKGKWSNNTFNSYRKNLSILFEELVELEATEVNPVLGIKKKKHAVQKKEVLTEKQCEQVDEFARNYDADFWKLIHIFYHSGARRAEIFQVQGKHVSLAKKEVKYLVKKGRDPEWVIRPIVDAAVPFWQMAMRTCRPEDFVFSVGLQPGPKPIRPEQITRRWRRHIKDKLGFDCDFYSLKHLKTTNISEVMSAAEAIKLTGHKSVKMIEEVYDVRRKQRENDALRSLDDKFGQSYLHAI